MIDSPHPLFVIRYYKMVAGGIATITGSVKMTKAEGHTELDRLRKDRPAWLAAAELVAAQ